MIETFATLIFISAISAAFSYFLDFCFEDGNIFGGWLIFLERKLRRFGRKRKGEPYRTISGVESWFYKPLGGCVVCSGVWQALVICPVLLNYFGQNLSIYNISICVILSNTIIRKLI